jgi:hypothetical protein
MEKLGGTCKELTSSLSILIANCKIAAAQTGEIPLQQSVLGVSLLQKLKKKKKKKKEKKRINEKLTHARLQGQLQ